MLFRLLHWLRHGNCYSKRKADGKLAELVDFLQDEIRPRIVDADGKWDYELFLKLETFRERVQPAHSSAAAGVSNSATLNQNGNTSEQVDSAPRERQE